MFVGFVVFPRACLCLVLVAWLCVYACGWVVAGLCVFLCVSMFVVWVGRVFVC